MWLTRLALRNPILVLMLSAMTVLLGLVSLDRLPLDLLPPIDVPMTQVAAFYPGAGAEDVEKAITRPLERAVSTTPNQQKIESVSRQGVALVTVWMNAGTALATAQFDVQQRVSRAMASLPPGLQPPFVHRFQVTDLPALWLAIASDEVGERELHELAERVIEPQLAGLPGVATTVVSGGRPRQIQVEVDAGALRARNLAVLDVVEAVQGANLVLPSGSLRAGAQHYNVTMNAQLDRLGDLGDVVVGPVTVEQRLGQASGPVRLAHIARVVDGAADQAEIVRIDGRRGVIIRVLKQPGANTLAVVDAIRGKLAALDGVPAAVKVTPLYDQARYIRGSIQSLQHEALLGTALTVVIVLIFLGSLRATGIVALAIPLSVVATFTLLELSGLSLNMFTLGGLVLAIGRLVDDSIVELENIERHLQADRGRDRRQAVLAAAEQVAMPILVSTLTTVVVFLPVLFLRGTASYIFPPLALTVAFALGVSFLVSRTVTPLLCYHLLQARHRAAAGPSLLALTGRACQALYVQVLGWALEHRRVTLALTAMLLTGAWLVGRGLGSELLPEVDEAQVTVAFRAPVGARVEEAEKVAARAEAAIWKELGRQGADAGGMVTSIGSTIGVPAGYTAIYTRNTGPHVAVMEINLVPRDRRPVTDKQIVERLRPRLTEALPGVFLRFTTGGFVRRILNLGAPSPIEVEVLGEDVEQGSRHARAIADRLPSLADERGSRLVSDVAISREEDQPEYRIAVDRQKASVLGLTQQVIGKTVLASLVGSIQFAPVSFSDPASGYEYPINVRLADEARTHVADLGAVAVRTPAGRLVPLAAVAQVTRDSAPVAFTRRHLQRVVTVSANVPPASDLGSATAGVRRVLAGLPAPAGLSVRLSGQSAEQASTFDDLRLAGAVALLLVYMVLAAQFRSLVDPLVIMTSVPLGVAGVFLVLAAAGFTLNVQSAIGMIMMAGIVVSNGVLLIEFANRLRGGGAPARAAVIEAARVRLRPIAMTTLCTIVGLVPMALGRGDSGEANASLAWAVIGGLGVSTAVTLVVLPVIYLLVHGRAPERGAHPSFQG